MIHYGLHARVVNLKIVSISDHHISRDAIMEMTLLGIAVS